jgi:hypothetical protein
MTLKSAQEDFESTTLGSVAGLLGKLSYTGSLHDGSGRYQHWGLESVYGSDGAQHAMKSAHRALISRILKTPLQVLLDDLSTSCTDEERTELEFLCSLSQERSLPKAVSSAAPAHLKSVLHALSALLESRHAATHPGA